MLSGLILTTIMGLTSPAEVTQVEFNDDVTSLEQRIGKDKRGQVRIGKDKRGQVRIGKDKRGQVRIGKDKRGQVRINANKSISINLK